MCIRNEQGGSISTENIREVFLNRLMAYGNGCCADEVDEFIVALLDSIGRAGDVGDDDMPRFGYGLEVAPIGKLVEGLKAPVPAPWETYYDDNDEIFYVNPVTGQKMYDHPLDEEYRQKFLRLKAEKEGNAQYANNQMDSYAA